VPRTTFGIPKPRIRIMDVIKLLTAIDFSLESQGLLGQSQSACSITWQEGKLVDQGVVFISSEDNSFKGALGIHDIDLICSAFDHSARNNLPVIFYLNSSGAKLDDGVAIQASFRKLIKKAMEFKFSGGNLLFLLGRNVFGGASMLAMSGAARLYSDNTRVSMTGPRVLEVSDRDSKEYVESVISRASRVKADPGAIHLDGDGVKDVGELLRCALFSCEARCYEEFFSLSRMVGREGFSSERVVVKPEGISCTGNEPPTPVDLLTLINAIDSWSLGDVIKIYCEWSSHSILAKHEESFQSKLLYMLSEAMYKKRKSGNNIVCYLMENISGGLYISLSSGSDEIYAKDGVEVESLPSQIISTIKKNEKSSISSNVPCLLKAGVIDGYF